jgi:hypothetical protein
MDSYAKLLSIEPLFVVTTYSGLYSGVATGLSDGFYTLFLSRLKSISPGGFVLKCQVELVKAELLCSRL